jgi:hypothetical protein
MVDHALGISDCQIPSELSINSLLRRTAWPKITFRCTVRCSNGRRSRSARLSCRGPGCGEEERARGRARGAVPRALRHFPPCTTPISRTTLPRPSDTSRKPRIISLGRKGSSTSWFRPDRRPIAPSRCFMLWRRAYTPLSSIARRSSSGARPDGPSVTVNRSSAARHGDRPACLMCWNRRKTLVGALATKATTC